MHEGESETRWTEHEFLTPLLFDQPMISVLMNQLNTFNVSVVISTYNRPSLLERCLLSIADQDCTAHIEVVVVDDCSTFENTIKNKLICGKYNNLKYIRCASNLGLSNSRNLGVENASAPILIFLDDDIHVERGYISGHLAILDLNKRLCSIGALRFPPELCMGNNLASYLSSRELRQRKEKTADELLNLEPHYFGTGICGLRKCDFARVGGYSDEFRFYGSEDLDMGIRLSQSGVTFIFASEAKADHYDSVSFLRYKNKAIENARYGVRLILNNHRTYLRKTGLRLLMPISDKDSALEVVRKCMYSVIFSRPTQFFVEPYLRLTNKMPVFYSAILFHVLFACWTKTGIAKWEDTDDMSSNVAYRD